MLRKLVLVCACTLCIGMLSAQVSYTNVSTAGLFSNDVDDYMSVNDWANVNPEKFFGFISYESNGYINTGAAHQFKKIYFGGFFKGAFDAFKTDLSTLDGKTSGSVKTDGATRYNFDTSGLFGFGKYGLKTSLSYNPTEVNNTTTNTGTKTVEWKNKYILTPSVEFGFNQDFKDYVLQPHFGAEVVFNVDKHTKKEDGTLKLRDDKSKYKLGLKAGLGIVFPKKGNIEQDMSYDLKTAFTFYPEKTGLVGTDDQITKGRADNTIRLEPGYRLTYTPSDRLWLKFGAELPLNLNWVDQAEYTEVGGVKTYTANRARDCYFKIEPAIKLATMFDAVPNKFRLNAGVDFALPELTWKFYNVENHGNPTKRGTEFTYKAALAGITWHSGFSWFFGKRVTFDMQWDILQKLFTNSNSKLETSTALNGQNVFFHNLNTILMHNFSAMVVVKI